MAVPHFGHHSRLNFTVYNSCHHKDETGRNGWRIPSVCVLPSFARPSSSFALSSLSFTLLSVCLSRLLDTSNWMVSQCYLLWLSSYPVSHLRLLFKTYTLYFRNSNRYGVDAMEERNKRISSSLLLQVCRWHMYVCKGRWCRTEAELYVRCGFCSLPQDYSLVETTSRCSSCTLSTISDRYWTANIYC